MSFNKIFLTTIEKPSKLKIQLPNASDVSLEGQLPAAMAADDHLALDYLVYQLGRVLCP